MNNRSMQAREMMRCALRIYLAMRSGEISKAHHIVGGIGIGAQSIGEFQAARVIQWMASRLNDLRYSKQQQTYVFIGSKTKVAA